MVIVRKTCKHDWTGKAMDYFFFFFLQLEMRQKQFHVLLYSVQLLQQILDGRISHLFILIHFFTFYLKFKYFTLDIIITKIISYSYLNIMLTSNIWHPSTERCKISIIYDFIKWNSYGFIFFKDKILRYNFSPDI